MWRELVANLTKHSKYVKIQPPATHEDIELLKSRYGEIPPELVSFPCYSSRAMVVEIIMGTQSAEMALRQEGYSSGITKLMTEYLSLIACKM